MLVFKYISLCNNLFIPYRFFKTIIICYLQAVQSAQVLESVLMYNLNAVVGQLQLAQVLQAQQGVGLERHQLILTQIPKKIQTKDV